MVQGNAVRHFCCLLVLCWGVLGCTGDGGGERTIHQKRSYQPLEPRQVRATDSYTRFGFRRPGAATAQSGGHNHGGFAHDTPPGWREVPPAQFRDINFLVAGHQNAECYLSVLGGGGGRIVENINRWRGQMGLAPASAADVDALPQKPLLGAPARYVQLEGTFQGNSPDWMLVALVRDDGNGAVSLKMIGPAAVLKGELENFTRLAASLRRQETAAATPPGAQGDPSGLPLVWDAPDSWLEGRERPMRAATYHPKESAETQCAIYIFRKPGGGDEMSNLQMWYGQMGQAASASALDQLAKIDVLGQSSRLVKLNGTYAGPGSEGSQPNYSMLAVYCDLPTHVICIKMTGPAGVMRDEEARFLAFCQSLKLSS